MQPPASSARHLGVDRWGLASQIGRGKESTCVVGFLDPHHPGTAAPGERFAGDLGADGRDGPRATRRAKAARAATEFSEEDTITVSSQILVGSARLRIQSAARCSRLPIGLRRGPSELALGWGRHLRLPAVAVHRVSTMALNWKFRDAIQAP